MEYFSDIVKGEERRTEQEGKCQRTARTKSESLRLPAVKMYKNRNILIFFKRCSPSSEELFLTA